MSYILPDGKELMARYDDILSFFEKHNIVGRNIADIRPAALDYQISNLDDIENIINLRTECAIDTDEPVCFIFEDGDTMEIEFSGDGPIILGFNTADLSSYPQYDGHCYHLATLFDHTIGAGIVSVEVEKAEHKMLFPSYCGHDMSQEDEGVTEIRLYLGGGKYFAASGWQDFFRFECHLPDGRMDEIEYRKLFSDMSIEALVDIFGDVGFSYKEVELESFSSTEIDDSYIDDVFGTFGFKDKDGNEVIEPQYASCGEFHLNRCPVAVDKTWYRTVEGRRYYEMFWGYIDPLGKVQIPFKFTEASNFNKYGVASVTEAIGNDEYRTYLIDINGHEIEGSCYPYIGHLDYDDRFVEFSNVGEQYGDDAEDNCGLYDTKERKIIYPPIASTFIEWDEDLILVYDSGNRGLGGSDFYQHYINSKGEELYPSLVGRGYNIVEKPNRYGYAIVAVSEYYELTGNPSSYFPINGKKYERKWWYGVAGPDGSLVIPTKYDSIKDKKNNTFECTKNGTATIIEVG